MNRICVDTSCYSMFLRGDPRAVEIVTGARDVCVPVVALGELRAGFRMGRDQEANERRLRAFLANPAVRVLDIDDEATVHYADIVAALRRAGTPVPTNDVWMAAVAAREGAVVVTFDDHFSLIDRVGSIVLTAT